MATTQSKKTNASKASSSTSKSTKKTSRPKKTVQAEVVTEKKTTDAENIFDSRLLILLSHLLGLVTSFVGALIIYLVAEDDLVKKHATAALNFQISLFIYASVTSIVGTFLTAITFGIFAIILAPFMLVLFFYGVIPPILATIKASDNIKSVYKYPFVIDFLK